MENVFLLVLTLFLFLVSCGGGEAKNTLLNKEEPIVISTVAIDCSVMV